MYYTKQALYSLDSPIDPVRNGAIFISGDADVVTMAESLGPDQRICAETGHATTCMENCHPRGEHCRRDAETGLRIAELEMIADGISDEQDPSLIERLSTFLKHGIMGPKEVRKILERALPPRIFNFPVKDLDEMEDLKGKMDRLYSQGLDVQQVVARMAEEGYNADTLLLGHDPGAEVTEPMNTFRPGTAEDLEAGDLIVMDGDGNARRALEGERVIGVALGDGRIRFTGVTGGALGNFASGVVGNSCISSPIRMSMAYGYGSMAFQGSIVGGYGGGFPRLAPGPARYQFNERFPKEVLDKAMALLAKFMSADQYKAFMEGSMIELQNKAEDYRVMLNRQGKFSILKGPRGEGIMMTSGNIGSFAYPIGDEIAVFLDWFRFRTLDLIERWNCGTFSIKDYL